jgi:predicted RNase H-like HicB family nuclease
MDYMVVIEKADDGSYVSCGDTVEEAMTMIQEAIQGHLQLIKEKGEPIPPPRSISAVIHAA